MIAFVIIVLFLELILLGWVVYALSIKIQKIEENQAIMIGWFDTVKKNEETLQNALKKLFNEFHAKKESYKGRIAPQAKESVRSR